MAPQAERNLLNKNESTFEPSERAPRDRAMTPVAREGLRQRLSQSVTEREQVATN
jgi:hypothetical protein